MTGGNRTLHVDLPRLYIRAASVGYGRPGTGLDRKLWRQQPQQLQGAGIHPSIGEWRQMRVAACQLAMNSSARRGPKCLVTSRAGRRFRQGTARPRRSTGSPIIVSYGLLLVTIVRHAFKRLEA